MPIADRIVTEVMRPTQPLNAFVYDRNSRLNPRGGTSIRDQDIENKRLCERNGWTVAATFEDPGRSASRYAKKKRPDFEEMIRRLDVDPAQRECDVVVVWEPSRAYRDTRAYLRLQDLCERRGVLLCLNGQIFDMESSDDRFRTHLDALLAERDVDKIRDNNKRTTRLNAERGRPHGRIGYGWRREYDPDTGALLRQVLHEEQAPIVQECARRVLSGESLYAIAQDLNDRCEPAPHAKEWSQLAVRSVLLRVSNIAKREHLGHLVADATWDPILDEVTFYGLKKLLEAEGRRPNRDSTVSHLLSNLVRCAVCEAGGDPIPRMLRPTRSSAGWSYGCRECYGVSIREPLLDAAVTAAVLAYVERPAFAASLVDDDRKDEVRAALAQAAAMEAQLADARRLASTWLAAESRFALSMETLALTEGRLLPLIDECRRRAQDASVPPEVRALAGADPRHTWKFVFDLPQRRAAIRGLVQVSLASGGKGGRRFDSGRLSWEWLR